MDPFWCWMSMLDRLTQGDITKDKEVLKMSYVDCLWRLYFWQEKDEYIDKINKAEEAKQKAKNR